MPLKPRKLDRENGIVRDASLIVIASEDTHAVKQYFQRFHTTKVQVEILPTEDGRSSPQAVVQRLDDYKADRQLGPEDELWACIDLDHWASGGHLAKLSQVMQLCRQKNYRLAISSPCFELWIYLHVSVAPTPPVQHCQQITTLLRAVVPSYSKKNGPRISLTLAHVKDAMERAALLPDAMQLAAGVPATGMHELLASLEARQPLRLREGHP
jgi:hypothetical protein